MLDDDYFDIPMTGIPRAWYRHVPAAVQERMRVVDPKMRIVREVPPPHRHMCVGQDARYNVRSKGGTLQGWFVIEPNIRGGIAGVEAFLSIAQKNAKEWDARGGDDADKQWDAHLRDEAQVEEDKLVRTRAEWDEVDADFMRVYGTNRVWTGAGIMPGDSEVKPHNLDRKVRRA